MEKMTGICFLGILLVCRFTFANHLTGAPVKAQLEQVFKNFVDRNEFYGAQIGIIQGTRLIYAGARGSIRGQRATPGELAPMLDLSKSLTAVAVLQLIETGSLGLDTKVFSPDGILGYITRQQNEKADPRLYNITVEHLLRHSAGWDETARPLLDPMMNQPLRALGYAVPDIARELGYGEGYLDQYDIIYYMTGQSLHYTPGQRVVHSNLGYSILGRVIEEVSQLPYEDYVKENILVPSGMWHTRIGPAPPRDQKQNPSAKDKGKHRDTDAYQKLTPQMLDSTLGWYSNVYDIARFFTALYGTGDTQLLRQATLDYALRRNPHLAKHHSLKWPALGLNVQADGSLILEASDRASGVSVFFYKEPLPTLFGDAQLDGYLKQANTAIIFIGFTNTHKKHMYGLHDAILSLNLHLLNENAYIPDLSDIELDSADAQILTKTKLSEHRLVAFTNAMRLAGYFPRWLHGYNHNGHSYFMAFFEVATKSIQLHYKLQTSPSRVKLYRFISSTSKDGYQVSLLQSFPSASHDNHEVHLVLMKRREEPQITMFSLCKSLESYKSELPIFLAEGYRVSVQSVERYQRQISVSYVLQKPVLGTVPETHSYHSLTLAQLEQTNVQQNKQSYYLSYIDTFVEHEQAKFSAIFQHRDSETNCLFQSGIRSDLFAAEALEKARRDYLPSVAAAYTEGASLFFAVQWVKK